MISKDEADFMTEMLDKLNERFCDMIQIEIGKLPLHMRTIEHAVYFYSSLTTGVYDTTEKFLQIAAQLSKEDARKFLTSACHGEFTED